jgi:hypothetical protein
MSRWLVDRGLGRRYDVFVTADLSLSPFEIHDLEDGSHQLWLFDGDMEQVEDVFDDQGAEGNGHGWESLAQALVRAQLPEVEPLIWFGSESGTFVAGSTDPAALRRLAERLHAAFHDRSMLARLIAEAEIGRLHHAAAYSIPYVYE